MGRAQHGYPARIAGHVNPWFSSPLLKVQVSQSTRSPFNSWFSPPMTRCGRLKSTHVSGRLRELATYVPSSSFSISWISSPMDFSPVALRTVPGLPHHRDGAFRRSRFFTVNRVSSPGLPHQLMLTAQLTAPWPSTSWISSPFAENGHCTDTPCVIVHAISPSSKDLRAIGRTATG